MTPKGVLTYRMRTADLGVLLLSATRSPGKFGFFSLFRLSLNNCAYPFSALSFAGYLMSWPDSRGRCLKPQSRLFQPRI